MTTLGIDNETTALLVKMAGQEHTTLAQLANKLLTDLPDAQAIEKAFADLPDAQALDKAITELLDAQAADKALAELGRGEDTVISLEDWESQLDAMAR